KRITTLEIFKLNKETENMLNVLEKSILKRASSPAGKDNPDMVHLSVNRKLGGWNDGGESGRGWYCTRGPEHLLKKNKGTQELAPPGTAISSFVTNLIQNRTRQNTAIKKASSAKTREGETEPLEEEVKAAFKSINYLDFMYAGDDMIEGIYSALIGIGEEGAVELLKRLNSEGQICVPPQKLLNKHPESRELFKKVYGLVYYDKHGRLWIFIAPDVFEAGKKRKQIFILTLIHEAVEASQRENGLSPEDAHQKAVEAEDKYLKFIQRFVTQETISNDLTKTLLQLFEEVLRTNDIKKLYEYSVDFIPEWSDMFEEQREKLAEISKTLGEWCVLYNTRRENVQNILTQGIMGKDSGIKSSIIYDFKSWRSVAVGLRQEVWGLMGKAQHGRLWGESLDNIVAIIGDETDESIMYYKEEIQSNIDYKGYCTMSSGAQNATARFSIDLSINENGLNAIINEFFNNKKEADKRHLSKLCDYEEETVKNRLKQAAIVYIWMERLIEGMKAAESGSVAGKDMNSELSVLIQNGTLLNMVV
ncbi:MAG: hypothetical protein KAR20_22180, partial [Candidatus Heimdallarchaeota archaeon]|nr:hypothetical protein [Candidatus Heimdallarchaeota archaeon]